MLAYACVTSVELLASSSTNAPRAPAVLRHPRRWLLALCAVLLALAWTNRFMQDDAYIVFRYAEHLAQGQGLVWNAGEAVEGYSSFLYTVLMAVPHRLGLEPVAAAHALGLTCFLGSLLMTFAAARWTFGSDGAALLTVALLGTNYTFSIFATGGLETSLHVCLVSAGLWLVARGQPTGWPTSALLALSLVAGLLLLVRPDSALPCAVLLGLTLWRLRARTGPPLWRALAALALPALVIAGAWLAWKLAYYGELLPNTYYVKVASPTSLSHGARYLYLFALSYWLVPLLVFALPLLPRLVRERSDALLVSLGLGVLWIPYLLRVGGDFMEFRFMVPIMPAMMLLIVWTVLNVHVGRAARVGLVALVLAGSLHHALAFDHWPRGQGPESRRDLQGHLTAPEQNWIGIGKALAAAAGADRTLMIAVAPAGAIPYYSGLPAIDMIGLSDWWVARHGDTFSTWPGHQRLAPYHYVAERGVHLIIGHPVLRPTSLPRAAAYSFQYFRQMALPTADPALLPPTVRVVEMPVNDGYYLPMLYIRPHAVVDGLLARGAWREARLAR